ncbi:TPA: conjugative transfer system coupling protein TraD [Photobacterium damselae]
MNKRHHHFWMENLFRPIFELNLAAIWMVGGLFTIIAGATSSLEADMRLPLFVGCGMIIIGLFRIKQGFPLMKRQYALFVNYFYKIDGKKFRKRNIANKEQAFLGRGFEWGTEIAQRAYQVMNMSSKYSDVKLPWILKPFALRFQKTTRKLGGKPWIHGLGDEEETYAEESIFHAHTVIFGNPGTGKTTLLSMLSRAAMHRDNVIIIVDPKNDNDWRTRVQSEANAMGLPFHFFHPSHPSQSCRIDPLNSYSRSTELASRIASLLPGESDSDPFVQFAWNCIYEIIEAMLYIEEKPQLTSIGHYLMIGKNRLAEKCLHKFFKNTIGDNWLNQKGKEMSALANGDLFNGMINYYFNVTNSELHVKALSDILNMVMHDTAHMSKMLSTTAPLFAQLTSQPLDELLSPKLHMDDRDETNPIVDIDRLVHTGGVLYVALDSLSDQMVASAIGKLICADVCAASARRYNFEKGEGKRVSLFIDEAHAVINDPVLNMLAVARGAKFELYVSSQTLPDYIAKTNEAQARRILGLASNLFCLRVNDNVTQDYATENFGEGKIRSVAYSLNSGTSTTGDLGDFSGGLKEQLSDTKEKLFPPTLLGDLPNLQYIARLADGRKIKGRIPFVLDKAA